MTTDKSNDIESDIESDVVPFEENSHQQIEPYFVAHLFDIQENNWSFSSNSTESESSFYICDLQDYLAHQSYNMEDFAFPFSNIKLELLKAELARTKDILAQRQIDLTILRQLDENENAEQIETLRQNTDELKQKKVHLQRDIQDITDNAESVTTIRKLPSIAEDPSDDFDWQMIIRTVDKVDGSDSNAFENTWLSIFNLCNLQKWYGSQLNEVIIYSLFGEASHLYNYMKKTSSLEEAIEALLTVYLNSDNLYKRHKRLNEFSRRQDERLDAAMQRLRILIDQTSGSYPMSVRDGRRDHLLSIALMKICSPQATMRISQAKAHALESGTHLNIDQQIKIALHAENVFVDQASHEIKVSLLDVFTDTDSRMQPYSSNTEILNSDVEPQASNLRLSNQRNRSPENIKLSQRLEQVRRRSNSRDKTINNNRNVTFDENKLVEFPEETRGKILRSTTSLQEDKSQKQLIDSINQLTQQLQNQKLPMPATWQNPIYPSQFHLPINHHGTTQFPLNTKALWSITLLRQMIHCITNGICRM